LAAELVKLPNKVAIEGHTDATPFGRADYSNWELSSDRANAARRILAEAGFDENRISQVRGFADQRLLKKDDPTSPSNRRISIIVRNMGLDQQEEATAQGQLGPGDRPAEAASGKASEKPAEKAAEKAGEKPKEPAAK